jgi:hypothetical protein
MGLSFKPGVDDIRATCVAFASAGRKLTIE